MIYTCTLNPSIDYVLKLDSLQLGELNRSKNESFHPGGKGINVSIVLNNLGLKSSLLGFLGGFTGTYIEQELTKNQNLLLDFINVESNTRVNIKLKGSNETEINATGPIVTDKQYNALLKKVEAVSKGDIFILSGSVPATISYNVYNDIAQIVTDNGATLIVDSSKDLLLTTLKYKPFLIKPNRVELEELFGVEIKTTDEVIWHAKELIKIGAVNVLVSLGEQGALLVTKNNIYQSNVPKGELINSVGAGDSMVAGFLYEYLQTQSFIEGLKTATACGSATAYTIGLTSMKSMLSLRDQVTIERKDE